MTRRRGAPRIEDPDQKCIHQIYLKVTNPELTKFNEIRKSISSESHEATNREILNFLMKRFTEMK